MNEQRRERAQRLRAGVFVLLGLLALLGGIYALGARARLFEARYTIHADFTEVAGLTSGATVRLAGVQIGRVSEVHLPTQPGGKVRVDLNISRRYADRIREDSVARIETQGLLGDKIVEITVGSARAAAVPPDGTIAARDPFDIGQVINESAQTVKNVAALAESLRQTAESFNQSKVVEDLAATAVTARRVATEVGREMTATARTARRAGERMAGLVEQIETGRGWAHVLLYEEPVALRKLDAVIASTQAVLDRLERGEGAVGVLTSAESAAAARRFVAAMDRFARVTEPGGTEAGALPALLFDPKYKAVLDDLRAVAQNFREVSERVAGGRGTLGGLVKDEPADAGLRLAIRDLQQAAANFRTITEKVNEGQGTIGALVEDPAVYERLVELLEGAQRSSLFRIFLRGLGRSDDAAAPGEGRPRP